MLTIDQIVNERSGFSTSEKINHLIILITALERKLKKHQRLQELANRFKPCNIAVIIQRCMGSGITDVYYECVNEVRLGNQLGEFGTSSNFPQAPGRSKQTGSSRKQIQSGLAEERNTRNNLKDIDEEKEYEGSNEEEEDYTKRVTADDE